jgi:phosphatidylserine decarboxylase
LKSLRNALNWVLEQPRLNFLITNRLPRRQLTLLMSRFSRIEQPLVRRFSIAVWRMFADVDLSEARIADFRSLHDCFIRELREGARIADPDPVAVTSPCDAIVGQCGAFRAGTALQAKGKRYELAELLEDEDVAERFANGHYATLRLTAGMYHRFHAPHDCRITRVTYIGGDVWNVNPPALRRVERLYCRNERAVVQLQLDCGQPMLLVPVAAILVAGIRLHCIPDLLNLRHRGTRQFACAAHYRKSAELGWFEHGSTIIAITPAGMPLHPGIAAGQHIRMGQALFAVATDLRVAESQHTVCRDSGAGEPPRPLVTK